MTEMTLPKVEEPKEEVTVNPTALAEVTTPIKKMHILICYDDSNGKITHPLDRHLQLMYRRLGSQVSRHYFSYRTIEEPKPYTGDNQYFKDQYQKEKAEYEKQLKDYNSARAHMIRFLQQEQLLLILYVSNSLMEHLWKDMAQLSSLLTNPNHRIAPVLITPTAGFAGNCEPLCAYDGVAFEVACQQVTTNLETIARDYFGSDLESPAVTPFTLLTSPTTVHVSMPSASDRTAQMLAELLGSIQSVVEQTNTRVVEEQRLAIAERSTNEERLGKQLDGMEQRLAALQAEQNASLLTKFRRLFKTSN